MKKLIYLLIIIFFAKNLYSLNLEQAIKIALKNNYLIKSKNYIVKSSQFKLKSAKSLRMPSLFVDSSFTQMDKNKKENISTPFGSQSFIINEENYFDITTGIKLNIYTGGLIEENIKLAKKEIEKSKHNLKEEKLEIIYKTEISYLNILILKAYEKIAEAHLLTLTNHLKDVKNLYNEGLVAYVDILQTKVKVKEAEKLLTEIRNNIKVAKTNLSLLLGFSPEKIYSVKDVNFKFNNYNLSNLYKIAIKNRPILKRVKTEISLLDNLINIQKSNYKPKIYISGGYHYTDISNNIEDKGNFFIKTGLKFNLDWDKPFQEIKSLKQKKMSLKFAFEDIKNKILLQTKKAFEEYKTSLKNLDVSKSEVTTAKEYYRIIDLKYKQGLADNTDVLDAEEMLTKAKMDLKKNYYNVIAKIFSIERATGKSLIQLKIKN